MAPVGGPKPLAVRFNLSCETGLGDRVFVVGSHADFGAWDPSKSKTELHTTGNSYPVWSAEWKCHYVGEAVTHNYKFVVRSTGGELRWEDTRGNRTLEVGSPGSCEVLAEFDCENPSPKINWSQGAPAKASLPVIAEHASAPKAPSPGKLIFGKPPAGLSALPGLSAKRKTSDDATSEGSQSTTAPAASDAASTRGKSFMDSDPTAPQRAASDEVLPPTPKAKTPRPAPPESLATPRLLRALQKATLDGHWETKRGGVALVCGNEVTWPRYLKAIITEKDTQKLSFELQGKAYSSRLVDGSLVWSDGDVWTRKQVGDEYSVLYGLVPKKAEADVGVDGLWWDGRHTVKVSANAIAWPNGQKMNIIAKTGKTISAELLGGRFRATLAASGRLEWDDGDIWVRSLCQEEAAVLPEPPKLGKIVPGMTYVNFAALARQQELIKTQRALVKSSSSSSPAAQSGGPGAPVKAPGQLPERASTAAPRAAAGVAKAAAAGVRQPMSAWTESPPTSAQGVAKEEEASEGVDARHNARFRQYVSPGGSRSSSNTAPAASPPVPSFLQASGAAQDLPSAPRHTAQQPVMPVTHVPVTPVKRDLADRLRIQYQKLSVPANSGPRVPEQWRQSM